MFFKKQESEVKNSFLIKICALLIHAAKIDEIYSNSEEEIIKNALIDLGADNLNIDRIISDATIIEENSNQILDFTREIKNLLHSDKVKIIESLWKIIYSSDGVDMYEANLMRRLAGLLYIDAKIMGELKDKAKRELKK